jgi:calcineurin-like phosphoesterase family protein
MDWFTSDLHLGHIKILEGPRGKLFNSIKDHDNIITNNILEVTSPGDNLYILGDIFWKYTRDQIAEFFNKFKKRKVNIHWIVGNHDRIRSTDHKAVVFIGPLKDITIEKQPITLCHYPMYTWNKSHYGAWHFFGHHHSNTHGHKEIKVFEESGKRLNVCCEFHNYRPISFEQIRDIMNTRPDNWDIIKSN